MYRPAIVIGLGGTGVLALRHLKTSLMATEQRVMPMQVKLIAVDTVKGGPSADTTKESKLAALRMALDPGEYFWVGGSVKDHVQRVSKGEQPQVGSWLQAQSYLANLPDAAFNLEQGAGQLRQFGRLAIFKDVYTPGSSVIKYLFEKAVEDIRKAAVNVSTIDVFLVASVAGGTGAGMFVDVAYLARKFAKQKSIEIRLKGFLVLPEAFSAISGGVTSAMRARAFACMRENKRFMVDFQHEHGYPMYYHDSGADPIWRSSIHAKLFDHLYHVDGTSEMNDLTGVLPEQGVSAVIADAIGAMLDKPQDDREDVYARHIANVLIQAGLAPEAESTTSFDSAFGCYSMILPMQQIVEWLSYKLALVAFERVFPATSRDGAYISALAEDANGESSGSGRNRSVSFLQTDQVTSLRKEDEKSAVNTEFVHDVAHLASRYNEADDSVQRVLDGREASEWERLLKPTGEGLDSYHTRIANASKPLKDEVPPNEKGETPEGALKRIKEGVNKYKKDYLGKEDEKAGTRSGGEYRKALEKYAESQLERYRLLLEIECKNILNGGKDQSDNASIHLGGKLGYLIACLDGIESHLGRFGKAVDATRSHLPRVEKTKANRKAANDALETLEEKPGGIWSGHRRSVYIEAEQELVLHERALIAEDVANKLVQDMTKHTKNLKEDAQRWSKALAVGYDSVHGHLTRGESKISAIIAAEKQVPVREYVWDEQYLADLYLRYVGENLPGSGAVPDKDAVPDENVIVGDGDSGSVAKSGVDALLEGIVWRYEERKGSNPGFGFRFVVNNEGLGSSQEANLEVVLTPARAVFGTAWRQESILNYLMHYGRFKLAGDLAGHLARKTGLLLNADSVSKVPANYLHVTHGAKTEEVDYLNATTTQMAAVTHAIGLLSDKVNSADRFALRLVYTADLIRLVDIDSYKTAETDYWAYGGDVSGAKGAFGREIIHVFPAEVNAARLESHIQGTLTITPRALHNDIVLQMEDMERFRLFVRCWAFDVIHRDQEEGSNGWLNFWCLDLPSVPTTGTGDDIPAVKIYLTRPVADGDPDFVEAMKCWSYERKDARRDRNLQLKIDYGRVGDQAKAARDQVVAALEKAGEPKDKDYERHFAGLQDEAEKKRLKKLWLERSYLKKKQGVLRKDIDDKSKDILAQDVAVGLYLVLDESVKSLTSNMDEMLERAKRLR